MIAHGAKHPRLQISKSQVVGKTAGVDLSIVVAARIAAVDDHAGSPEASHIRERHRLVVEQQVRLDSAIKGLSWSQVVARKKRPQLGGSWGRSTHRKCREGPSDTIPM